MNKSISSGRKFPIVWIVFLALSIGILGAILAGYNWYRGDFDVAARQLPKELARAKKLGLPLTAADLQPKPPIKPEDNAGPLLKEITAKLGGGEGNKRADATLNLIEKSDLVGASQGLKAFDDVFFLAEQAAKKSACDFERDWNKGYDVLFPEFGTIKAVIKLLICRAQLKAKEGKNENALADLRIATTLSQFSASDPQLISKLVGFATEAIVFTGYERCIAIWVSDRQMLQAARRQLEGLGPLFDIKHGLRGEAFMGYHTALHIKKYLKNEGGIDGLVGASSRPPLVSVETVSQAWQARTLESWNDVFELIDRYGRDPKKVIHETNKIVDKIERSKDKSLMLNQITVPAFGKAYQRPTEQLARRRAILALAKILEFKAQYGKLPATLKEANAEFIDPFSDKPLKYKLMKGGCRVYSLGEKLVDDGGLVSVELPTNSSNRNLVYGFPPVPHRR